LFRVASFAALSRLAQSEVAHMIHADGAMPGQPSP